MKTQIVTHEMRQSLRECLMIAYRTIESAQEEFPDEGNLKRMDEIGNWMAWAKGLRGVELEDWTEV